MKKKLIVLMIAVIAGMILYCGAAMAETGGTDGNLTWILDDNGVLTISGNGDMRNHGCIYVDDNEITAAPWGAGATSIVIIDGVTSIGDYAFTGCRNLISVTIPESVTMIGYEAFSYCTSLKSIIIPDSVTSIGGWTFLCCSDLINVSIPDSIPVISDSMFNCCSSLTSITIPDSVTAIGNNAFNLCESLTGVTIPDSVTSIGYNAFADCYCLTNITIPNGITRIDDGTFANCSSLTSVTIPDNVTNIGGSAFANCSGLTSVTIPDNVTSIEYSAFYNCTGLTEFTIPSSVTDLGYQAFYGCTGLANLTIPDSVLTLGGQTFNYCSGLKSVTIGNGVTCIEYEEFAHCTSLTDVIIGNSVTSIGNCAFMFCSSLKNITIPDNVTSIGGEAFYGCSLKSLALGKNVTSIGYWAVGCPSTIIFAVEDENLAINYGENFMSFSSDPVSTIYCHEFTSPYYYFSSRSAFEVVLLEDIDIDSIRTVTLPDDFRLACGDSQLLHPNIFPAYGDPVTWTSSDPSVLSVTDGMVTALTPGTATVTATVGTVSGSVIIEVYPAATDFDLNAEELWVLSSDDVALSVVSYEPEGASAVITWSVSDSSLAQVDENGLVSTVGYGDVTVTATTEKSIIRTCLIHLFPPVTSVSLTAPQSRMITGLEMQLTAFVTADNQSCENHLVNFTSSDPALATVDIESGIVHAVAPGMVTITATSRSNESDSVEILILDECGEHIPVTDEAIAPTCTESGFTEGSHCLICNEVLVPQIVVPATGHNWSNPEYTWSDDNTAVTAASVCANNPEHTHTETVGVQRIATVSPTQITKGEYKFMSLSFEEVAYEVQEKAGGTIPALGTLNMLVLPEDLMEIDAEAFLGLSCQAVIIPDGCTTIGSRAFAGCEFLVYVRIPACVAFIGTDVFAGCPGVVIDRISE